jgi:hypothetical protein
MPGAPNSLQDFPSTHQTWLGETLHVARGEGPDARAARDRVNAHVMQRYFEPLCACVRSSRLARLDEPADLVNAFFASRLTRADYLESWLASELPLRRWLANGLLLSLRERVRSDVRRAAREAQAALPADAAHDMDAQTALDRAWAEQLVQSVVQEVSGALAAEGRTQAWQVFRRRAIDGITSAALQGEMGLAANAIEAAMKLVTRRLRAAIEAHLRAEGVRESEIEQQAVQVLRLALGEAGV